MDEPLLVYRLNKNSKSGNKIRSARMNWKTYRAIGLNLPETVYYMAWYTVRGIKKYRHLRA
jgi:teichuronic acid biosynthesis glycosyltransferase TuaG